MTSQEISQDEAFERNQWHESKRFMDDVRAKHANLRARHGDSHPEVKKWAARLKQAQEEHAALGIPKSIKEDIARSKEPQGNPDDAWARGKTQANASKSIDTGPRGGRFYLNRSGEKVYVK